MIEQNKIYNEDCLVTMGKMPDKFVDLVITSPPYNMNLRIRNGKYCSRQIVKEFSTKYNNFSDNLPIDTFYNTHVKILSELLRVSSLIFYNIQIVTGSKRAFFKLIGKFCNQLKEIIIWDKIHSQPAMASDVLNSRYEIILIFGDNPISRQFTNSTFERGTLDNLWCIKKQRNMGHKASFPKSLVEKILINFSQAGNLVYDPFMGSGTTAICAKKLNRKWIGSEISKEYCELARKRIMKQEKQL